MTSPKNNDKDEKQRAGSAVDDALQFKRSYTTGGKLGARQMFVFNEDGTIAGLKEVQPKTVEKKDHKSGKLSDTGSKGDKKFGAISSQMSAYSLAETKVAFSDANYTPKAG